MFLLAICTCSFENCLSNLFAHLLIGLLVLVFSFWSSPYILDINPLSSEYQGKPPSYQNCAGPWICEIQVQRSLAVALMAKELSPPPTHPIRGQHSYCQASAHRALELPWHHTETCAPVGWTCVLACVTTSCSVALVLLSSGATHLSISLGSEQIAFTNIAPTSGSAVWCKNTFNRGRTG